MGGKFWSIFFGLGFALIIVTAWMPECFLSQWQCWVGGVIGLGIVFGVISYQGYRIDKLEEKIEELEDRLKKYESSN